MLLACGSDRVAFTELYLLFYRLVSVFLVSKAPGLPEEDVHDLSQETFVRAWAYRRRFRARSSAKTYLLGIAKNVLRERRRVQWPLSLPERVERASVEVGLLSEPEAVAYRQELWEAFSEAMKALSLKEQRAVELFCLGELSSEEAARIEGCSRDAFRVRVHSARRKLRGMLERFR